MSYKPTIGLEIHAELNTQSKMFCSCKNTEEIKPNTNICPVCTAQPGVLPVINEEAVKKVIQTGLSLNCKIPEFSKFDRKNYFYPDLPKGYQISQYDKPLCIDGFLKINGKKIRVKRVHLEEDTGRLLHPEGLDYSLVDFNRAGVPLMELVTEPDISNGKEASQFAQELQLIFTYLGVSEANMEKGQMRVEVNISVSKDDKLGTKVEIKNLNSFRAVEKSIDFEIKRQQEVLESGEKIIQETRGWDDVHEKTVSQRTKEEAHDYRYFPEPDLPPLHFKKEDIEKIKKELPELPEQRKERFKKEYGLEEKIAEIFVKEEKLGEKIDRIGKKVKDDKTLKNVANHLITDLKSDYNFVDDEALITIASSEATSDTSSRTAKDIFSEIKVNNIIKKEEQLELIKKRLSEQINDSGEIEKAVLEIISSNPKVIEDYKNGKGNALQFLIGQVMAKTKGKANPQMVKDILNKKL